MSGAVPWKIAESRDPFRLLQRVDTSELSEGNTGRLVHATVPFPRDWLMHFQPA